MRSLSTLLPLVGMLHFTTALPQASPTASAPATATFTPPPNCPVPTWTVVSLEWHHGSHFLDCAHNDRSYQACYCNPTNSTGGKQQTCDPSRCAELGGHFVAACGTGMPTYQPWGYGPIETLDTVLGDGTKCHDEYIGYRIHYPGEGGTNCGYADRAEGRIVAFYGSPVEGVSKAHIDYASGNSGGKLYNCDDGKKVQYWGTQGFDLSCSLDAGRNATCTAANVTITPNRWEYHA